MADPDAVADLLQLDHDRFADRLPDVLDSSEYDGERLTRLTDEATVDSMLETLPESGSLADHEAAYVRRIRVLDHASVGITLAGPAYADNPVVYANATLRDITGYELEELRGENLRLLQGPETESEAVADLREALSTWRATTVTLTNYRADGSRFRNRVTLAPVTDSAGTVVNWLGMQQPVDG
ncbi:PAS domain-containing protein [Halobaculum halobium]|uniref:PAS domain-containing protein n=1 Tax=Halobaculum halobium TaxID=3032281 RepID=A0ABD5T7L7_9EURY|nr:PAS domain-containing protein [Halobaculum sp. SYNS20]